MDPDSRRRCVRLDDRQWAGLLLFIGVGQFAVIGLTVSEAVYSEASPSGYSISQNYISDLGVGPGSGGMERMIVWPILVWGTAFGGYLFGSSSPAPAAAASP